MSTSPKAKPVTSTAKPLNTNFSNDRTSKPVRDNNIRPQYNTDKKPYSKPQDKKMDSRRSQNLDRKIKDVVEMDVPTDKENNTRDYTNNKLKDRQKQNRIDESRNSESKSSNNAKRNNRRNEEDYDSGKLNSLKKHNKLSTMFHEDGEMLDYYDLSTEKKRNKKKPKTQEAPKQKQKSP